MVQRYKFLSIVVPTFQEGENIRPLVTRIAAVMNKVSMPYEAIVVDDNSKDGSVEIINELAEEGYPVRIISRIGTRGLSTAVICGFHEARGDILACMDADLSHPPEALLWLIKVFENSEVEFAIGSRYVPGAGIAESWGVFRWLNSKLAKLLARPFTPVKDPLAGFFMLPHSVFVRADSLNPIGFKIGLELIVKCSCHNIVEVPITFENRKYGQSKLTFREQFNYIRQLKRLVYFRLGEIL
ncbi:MAG: polyprenol monophosphomannose synthase [Nitrospinales bacterium]